VAFLDLSSMVASGFRSESSRQYGTDYLTTLRQNWRDAEGAYRRTTILLAISAILAELATQGGIAEFTISGIKLKNLQFLALAAPVVVSYLTIEAANHAATATFLRRLHDAIMKELYPELEESYLELPLAPSTSLLYESMFSPLLKSQFLYRVTRFYSYLRGVLLGTLPIAFLIHHYMKLVDLPHSGFLYVSLIASGLLMMFALAAIIITLRAAW
jgi:hypothetical protein